MADRQFSLQALRSVTCVILCVAFAAHAGIVETVRERYGKASSIATDLELTILWKAREKTESKTGRMVIAPGDKFRVELGTSTWVCDGQTVWQYNSQANQVIVKRLLDFDLSTHPSQILASYVNTFAYRVLEETDKQATLQWEADSSQASSFYRQITIAYDTRKAAISSLVVIDRHGNESTYRFSKTVFGETAAKETFVFQPPKDANVLDDR